MSDTNSTYERNIAESGAALSIIRDSLYTGTGINFDSNEAEAHAGAVLVDT